MIRVERLNILSHLLQLSKVKNFGTAHELFQLLRRVQLPQHLLIKKFEEPFLKKGKLSFTLLFEEVLNVCIDELLAIILRDKNVFATWNEFISNLVSKMN